MADGMEPEVIGADDVAAPNLHEVNAAAVAAAAAKDGAQAPAEMSAEHTAHNAATLPPNVAGRMDRNGRGFDPALHETDANGLAVLRSDGRLKMKPGTRAASKVAPKLPPIDGPAPAAPSDGAAPTIDGEPAPALAAQVTDYRAVSKGIVLPLLGFIGRATDKEYEFSKDERDGYVEVVAQLCEKYGVTGGVTSPELVLALMVGGSVYERREKHKTKWAIESVVGWLRRLFRRKVAAPATVAPAPGDAEHAAVPITP